MTIWLASGNKHKQRELADILQGHTIKLPADAGIAGFDPEETGLTFADNALIKANALYKMLGSKTGEPVLADDSGLCVDALGGRPGIYSARYYGKDSWDAIGGFKKETVPAKLEDKERNLLLLQELELQELASQELAMQDSNQDLQPLNRSARFVCAMVLLFNPDRFYLAQETLEGQIITSAKEIRGDGGFGYDPVMYLPPLGKTVAELSDAEKNSISHRAKAAKAIEKILA